jgi:U3 small nucleolar RNA-associated protein 22
MNRVVLFAATNLDEEGTTWTDKSKPEKVVAARLTALAKAATQTIRADEDRLLRSINAPPADVKDDLTPESLFATNVSEYDIVIHINSKHSLKSSKKRKSDVQFKNLEIQQSSRNEPAAPPLPLLFAEELLDLYGDAVLWFWDPETLDKVVGLWNSEPVRAKKSGDEEKSKEVDIKVNKAAVIHEIRRLGGELIREIYVQG